MLFEYLVYFLTIYASVFYLLTYLENRERLSDPPVKRKPTISVIIPAYNEEKTIKQTIDSVLKLNYPKEKIEIIVVNDGSTDRTANIVKGFAGVKLINKENGGKASALNIGIREAKGELIATLDADSFIEPDILNYMLGYFEDKDVAAVVPTLKVYEPKTTLQKLQRAEYLFLAFFKKILSFLDGISVTPGPFSLYRADIFKKLGGFDENNLTEDTEMALRIQSARYKIQNSYNALVHTVTPSNFPSLFKQRRRWYSGYLENVYRYRFMCNPKYGDFGVFVLPIGIILLFLGLFMFTYTAYNTLFSIRLHHLFLAPEFDLFYIQPSSLTILWLIVLSTVFFVLYFTSRQFNEPAPLTLFISYILLSFFLTFFWIYSVFERFVAKIRGRGMVWRGK